MKATLIITIRYRFVKFSIVANTKQENVNEILKKVIGFVDDFELDYSSAKFLGLSGIEIKDLTGDVIISLGGDGTILHILSQINKPILGINCGGVGFLNELEPEDDIFTAIDRISSGKYFEEKLHRIDTFLNDLKIGTAVNEIVLHSSRVAKIQGFEISTNGKLIDRFRGDGVIIATPTGSTSYSMSVGAPIIYPTMKSNLIVPMAAYKLGSRPLILPSNYEIFANITGHPEAVMVIDGKDEIHIKKEDKIEFKASKSPASLIRFNRNFFDRLRNKLRL